MADADWMNLALAEAARGLGAVEPNPMVGAVVVRDNQLVGLGHHERFGGPHAEVMALRQAGGHARGATLYVTLEPCCHHGKTPPCVDAILAAGISRVVAAHRDPFPKVAGGGLAQLRAAGVEVDVGLAGDRSRHLNAAYLKRVILGIPFVTAKWAMTLDGRTATGSGDSRWISNAQSRSLVHEVRGRMDAILVGIGTALADDPELTARPPGPRTPARVVLDSWGRLPLASKLVQTSRDIPVWVATTDQIHPDHRAGLVAAGCEILDLGPATAGVPIGPLLTELARRGVTNLLVEGGGQVLGSFLDAGQVDAVDVFIAPRIEGGSHSYSPARGKLGHNLMADSWQVEAPETSVIDGDVRVQGRIRNAPWSVAVIEAGLSP